MLAITHLGADTGLWSVSTGACEGFDAYCRTWSGSAGVAYNCVGCTTANQDLIKKMQGLLLSLIKRYDLAAQFSGSYAVAADKVIGLMTARAVGIVGSAALAHGVSGPVVEATIGECVAQRAALEAKQVNSDDVQQTIRDVAKCVPSLIAFLEAALAQEGVSPGDGTPGDDSPVAILDFDSSKRRRGLMLVGTSILLGAATGLVLFVSHGKRKRKSA